jgi:predicted transcriptional regulator
LINELESLGISSEKINDYLNDSINEELNSITELTDLVENIKQTMYQEYKTAYSERMCELQEEEQGAGLEKRYIITSR